MDHDNASHLLRIRRPLADIHPADQHEVYVFGLLVVGLTPDGRLVVSLYSRDALSKTERRRRHPIRPRSLPDHSPA